MTGVFPSPGSLAPANADQALDVGQRQRLRLCRDRVALAVRETSPRLDRQLNSRASPRPDDLAADDDGARPDARGPKLASTTSVRHQDLAIARSEERRVGKERRCRRGTSY